MIDTNAQRAECARMEVMLAEFNDGYEFRTTKEHVDFVAIARADWPALIKAHREALDEIERLRAAGKVLAADLRSSYHQYGSPVPEKEANACRVFEEGE